MLEALRKAGWEAGSATAPTSSAPWMGSVCKPSIYGVESREWLPQRRLARGCRDAHSGRAQRPNRMPGRMLPAQRQKTISLINGLSLKF